MNSQIYIDKIPHEYEEIQKHQKIQAEKSLTGFVLRPEFRRGVTSAHYYLPFTSMTSRQWSVSSGS